MQFLVWYLSVKKMYLNYSRARRNIREDYIFCEFRIHDKEQDKFNLIRFKDPVDCLYWPNNQNHFSY